MTTGGMHGSLAQRASASARSAYAGPSSAPKCARKGVFEPLLPTRRCTSVAARAAEAPDLVNASTSGREEPPPPPPPSRRSFTPRRVQRAVEKSLSNLQLAISEMALLAFLSGVGTVIEQDQTAEWYIANFPDGPNKVLGFMDYSVVFFLQLDHIYTSSYFLGLTALLSASLIACSRTQQWPLVKVSRRWNFPTSPAAVFAKGSGETLAQGSVRDLAQLLDARGYAVFLRDGALYAFKGIAGRFAPIGVHVSLLLIIAGASLGALAGLEGDVMIPGTEVITAESMRARVPFIPLPEGAGQALRCDSFTIDYRPDGSVAQFRSVISRRDVAGSGGDLGSKEIYVNEPLRFGGVTAYQTDWAISRVLMRTGAPPLSAEALASDPVSIPMADLTKTLGQNANSKLFGTFVPLELPNGISTPRGVTVLARDLQQLVFYDSKGAFVGVRRPGSGSPITVEGTDFIVDRMDGASGLQLKADPGVPMVYTGFGFLMLTSIVSYLSHSQVWALQDGKDLHVGGRTNRATIEFRDELSGILDAVPEGTA